MEKAERTETAFPLGNANLAVTGGSQVRDTEPAHKQLQDRKKTNTDMEWKVKKAYHALTLRVL